MCIGSWNLRRAPNPNSCLYWWPRYWIANFLPSHPHPLPHRLGLHVPADSRVRLPWSPPRAAPARLRSDQLGRGVVIPGAVQHDRQGGVQSPDCFALRRSCAWLGWSQPERLREKGEREEGMRMAGDGRYGEEDCRRAHLRRRLGVPAPPPLLGLRGEF
jgi:hypothetical protein